MTPEQPRAQAPPRTDALISKLAADLRPVRRIWSPGRRLTLWAGALALTLVLSLAMLGLRPDAAARLGQASFILQLGALLAISVASAALALRASVPGQEPPVRLGASVIALATAGFALACAREPVGSADALGFVAAGWPCALATVIVATLPLLLLAGAIRRAAPLAPTLAGLLAGGAAFFAAAATLRLVCPLDERWHLVVWHVGPVAIGLVSSLALGAIWLSRWQRPA